MVRRRKHYSQKSPYSLMNDYYRCRRNGQPVTDDLAKVLVEKMPKMFYLDENGCAQRKIPDTDKEVFPKPKRTPEGFIDYTVMSDEELNSRLATYGVRIYETPRRLSNELARRFPDKYEISKHGYLTEIGAKKEPEQSPKGIPGIDYLEMPLVLQMRNVVDEEEKLAEEYARACERKIKVKKVATVPHGNEKKTVLPNLPLMSVKDNACKYSLVFRGANGVKKLISDGVAPYEVLLIDRGSHFSVVRKSTETGAKLFVVDLLYGEVPAQAQNGFARLEYMTLMHELYGFEKIGADEVLRIGGKLRNVVTVNEAPDSARSVLAKRGVTVIIGANGVESTCPLIVLNDAKAAQDAAHAMKGVMAKMRVKTMSEHTR